MPFAGRTALLRLVAMAALGVSALLTADYLHPERAFCPFEEACTRARESALGEIAGVPTSEIGMLAFGALFLLTLLPVEWSRPLLRPAGLVAALAGGALLGFQALVLQALCPLCLVADAAGLLAGILTVSWPPPPILLSGKRLPGEPASSRLAWTLAAGLAVVVPFALPRQAEPAWVEITPVAEAEFGLEDETAREDPPAPEPVVSPAASGGGRKTAWNWPGIAMTVEAPAAASPPPTAPAPPPTSGVRVVEYLNPFCAHCRATERRLDAVVQRLASPPRIHRVYTWNTPEPPAWAVALDHARTVGLEDRLFEALLEARDESVAEVLRAAERAGLEAGPLSTALARQEPSERSSRHRRLVMAAGLRGLPTLDIGRRRLMGEQSEAEIEAAIRAAEAP
jgi:uncharacterized membrane protein